MKQWITSLTLVLGAVILSPLPALAQTDPLIEGAKMCTRHLTRYERQYGIPTHLLSAISTVESGRYDKDLKIRLPWPWAVNVEGQGYMYDTKEEAIAAVRKFRAHGAKSIDVGCMQVNLVHHASAFSTLEKAFDPESNIAYAASFLRNLYEQENSWKKAAADYHSKTPGIGRQYAGQVFNSWYEIIDKLRDARMQTAAAAAAPAPATTTSSATLVADNEPAPRPVPTPTPKPVSHVTHERLVSVKSSTPHVIAHPHVQNHDNDVLVINSPDDAPKPILVAEATRENAGPKIIHIDPPAVIPVADTERAAGPNFIFRD